MEAATDYARETGRTTSCIIFNDPEGPFVTGDWYIYAYDYEGTLLAHPYERDKVGTNRMNWTTPDGLEVIRLGADIAEKGGGYILYIYPRPGTDDEINESAKSRYQPKLGYVTPINDEWWVGSDLYFSDMEDESITAKVDELVGFVDEAVVFARDHGKSAALLAFNVSGSRFTEGTRYIFALDYNGTLLAYSVDPGRVGESDLGVVRAYGVKSVNASIEVARQGRGFVVYSIRNPVTGQVEQKLSYVRPVDDTWWLGSGIYLSELVPP